MFSGIDSYTTKESENIIRLPIYHNMTDKEIIAVCDAINGFSNE